VNAAPLDRRPGRTDTRVVELSTQVRQLLGKRCAAGVSGNPGGLVVVAAGADPQSEREPPAGQGIHRQCVFGEEGGGAQRPDRDVRGQPHTGRDRSSRRQRGERLDAVVHEPVEHAE
jgi:hypothetical protein